MVDLGWDDAADVVVVGGGGAGLRAALAAAQAGADVVLLEKTERPGGKTWMSIGIMTGSATPHQKKAGIRDSHAKHFADLAAMTDRSKEKEVIKPSPPEKPRAGYAVRVIASSDIIRKINMALKEALPTAPPVTVQAADVVFSKTPDGARQEVNLRLPEIAIGLLQRLSSKQFPTIERVESALAKHLGCTATGETTLDMANRRIVFKFGSKERGAER